MLEKLPFKIYKRTLKSGKCVFYARFLLPDGTYTSGRSLKETSRKKAELVAWDLVQKEGIAKKKNLKLKEFAKGFFEWDSEWALSKRSSGKRISPDQCKKNDSATQLHVIRILGEIKISEIDNRTIRYLRNTMYLEDYSGSTINKALGCLKAILQSAEDYHLIGKIPRFERAALRQKATGILSMDEVARLFSIKWKDQRAYVANLIAAATGFRLGEILGIKVKNIISDYIRITGSWNTRTGTFKNGTKNGQEERKVPIPPSIQEEIQKLIASSPYPLDPENFLFWAKTTPYAPVQDRIISKGFHDALRQIGIDEDERKRRRIKFHSHRHFFNSLLVESRIPLQKIQQLTGHLSNSMTQRYYHLDDLSDVEAVTSKLFDDKIISFEQIKGA